MAREFWKPTQTLLRKPRLNAWAISILNPVPKAKNTTPKSKQKITAKQLQTIYELGDTDLIHYAEMIYNGGKIDEQIYKKLIRHTSNKPWYI